MSATQSRSGAGAEKSRPTRSGAGAATSSRRVVRALLRRCTPWSPRARIRRATRFFPTGRPSSLSSAAILGAPYVPRLTSWMALILPVSSRSRRARSEGGRESQA